MSTLRDCLRWLAPCGLIERHRRAFQLRRLGLPNRADLSAAVRTSRYELWPVELRSPKTPWTLVDVGANEGAFVEAVARLAPLSGVFAFEPQEECQAALRRAVSRVPCGHAYRAAVGDRGGEIRLICTEDSKLSSVLPPRRAMGRYYSADDLHIKRRISVRQVRLDDIVPPGKPVGLVKIDVQGYELPVLEGAVSVLENTFAVLLEVNYLAHYEGGATFDAVYHAVRERGFRVFGISEPYAGVDGPLWADAMFVNENLAGPE